jgi:hypothetical protein
VRALTRTGVLVSTLLGLMGGCSFPDPTFVDAAGGSGSGAAGSPSAGTGGSSSGAGGSCAGRCEPQLVAEEQGDVIAIAVNDTRVYWISKLATDNDAELRSAPIAGGTVEAVTSDGLGWSAGVLAVDQATAFVANQSSGGALVSLGLSDGVMDWTYDQERIDTIFQKGSNIYYSAPYGVVLLPKDGPDTGGRLELSTMGPRLLMLDDEDLLVLDQSVMREPPRRVVRLRADGSQPFAEATVVLDVAPDFDSAAADTQAYYFADADQGEIVRLLRVNPSSVEPLAQDEASPRKLQLQSGVLYWTSDSGDVLRSMTTSGEKPVTVDDAVPTVVTASPAGVFWATPGGSIKRLEP